MLSATGNPERAEILKQHADEEVCALVLSLLDKVAELHRQHGGSHDHDSPDTPDSQVRTETTADLNVLHEQRSKCAAEGHERSETELKRRHEEEKGRLTETFRAAEDVLKVRGGIRLLPLWRSQRFSCVCVLPEGGGAAAVGGAAGLQPAEDQGPGVHLQEGPAEEHSGAAPWWTGRAEYIQDRPHNVLLFPPPGPRQPRCILGVGAGVSVVRHRDEDGASAGAEQEAAEHGGSGKRRRLLWPRESCAQLNGSSVCR